MNLEAVRDRLRELFIADCHGKWEDGDHYQDRKHLENDLVLLQDCQNVGEIIDLLKKEGMPADFVLDLVAEAVGGQKHLTTGEIKIWHTPDEAITKPLAKGEPELIRDSVRDQCDMMCDAHGSNDPKVIALYHLRDKLNVLFRR